MIEVASNREGPENAERLFELLGKSENVIIVRDKELMIGIRMVWWLKMRIKANKYGKSERRSHLLSLS